MYFILSSAKFNLVIVDMTIHIWRRIISKDPPLWVSGFVIFIPLESTTLIIDDPVLKGGGDALFFKFIFDSLVFNYDSIFNVLW